MKTTEEDTLWDNEGEVNYLDTTSENIYQKEKGFTLSKLKAGIIIVICSLISLCILGYLNTDFDENNKAYIVSYDLHYERQYVKESDNVFDYCLQIQQDLQEIMPKLPANSLTYINEVKEMKDVLIARTNELSRYTEIPELMSNYHDALISFSLSTQQMMDTMLNNYTSADYMIWAESAYADFCNSLESLSQLREQIDAVIYRNVYGGE